LLRELAVSTGLVDAWVDVLLGTYGAFPTVHMHRSGDGPGLGVGGRCGQAVGRRALLDFDATIATAHSEKELATPTWKHTFGFHPLAWTAPTSPPVKLWPGSSGRAGPGRTPPPITSGSSTSPWPTFLRPPGPGPTTAPG
jgi:hypothetical protein